MKRIVLLKCPGNLNVGNEFVNVGSEHILKVALQDAGVKEYEMYTSEFWTTNMTLHTHASDWNTHEMKRWINQCDLIVISAGSIVSAFMEKFLEDVRTFVPPVIVLGAGMLTYDTAEQELAKYAFENSKFVVCRDSILFETIKDYVPSLNGLDMAFFLNNAYTPPWVRGDYAVLNMDFSVQGIVQRKRKHQELKKKFEMVYSVENTSTLHKGENTVFLSRWTEFCNLYANAAFVSTMRVHTALVCTVFGTPFEYTGKDAEPYARRSALFRQVDMPLERKKIYTNEELREHEEIIRRKKGEVIRQVSDVLRSVLFS